ncbi:MarR family transcriptional regulator [Microbacterium sp. X-17]|uniref:MarR family transcriptional regulator n=1 Tax=Microbacterium sp. X-17 TaxID=3144404 RepID=UPI0031F53864
MSDDVVRFQTQLRTFVRRLRTEQPLVEGLSRGAVRLLHLIFRAGGPTTPGAVAELLGMTSSNVAPILRELETAGLVRRERDPDDARRVRVILSDRGRTVCERSREGREEWLREAIATTLDPRERALLFATGDLLERMAAAAPRLGTHAAEKEEVRG